MDWELIETKPDGSEVRKYPNGDLRNEKGHLLEAPARIKETQITTETASAMGKRRKEKIIEAVEQGVMKVTAKGTPEEAVGALIAKRAQIAMNDDGRTGNEATKIVLGAMDAMPDKVVEMQHNQTVTHELDDETREVVERMLASRRQTFIDGEATDA